MMPAFYMTRQSRRNTSNITDIASPVWEAGIPPALLNYSVFLSNDHYPCPIFCLFEHTYPPQSCNSHNRYRSNRMSLCGFYKISSYHIISRQRSSFVVRLLSSMHVCTAVFYEINIYIIIGIDWLTLYIYPWIADCKTASFLLHGCIY